MHERVPRLPGLPKLYSDEQDFRAVDITNLSGFAPWELDSMNLRRYLSLIPAESMVVFPDVSPTEKGLIPTGVMARFNPERTPNWRHFIRGADIGCGMLTARLPIRGADFQQTQQELDAVMEQLRRENLTVCFRGNHFVNFATHLESDEMIVVVHTGSFGDLQVGLGSYVDNPNQYNDMYQRTVQSAQETRARILRVIENVYGATNGHDDVMHNTIEEDSTTGMVTVYKGVIQVTGVGQQVLLPSSASGLMAIYNTSTLGAEVGGTSHGTGRKVSRSEMKVALRQALVPPVAPTVMMPTGTEWPQTEYDVAYHPPERTLEHFESIGLITPQYGLYQPLAGIKGV